MKLFEFTKRFPDEQACEAYLKEQREKSGIVCKNVTVTKIIGIATTSVGVVQNVVMKQRLRQIQ